ncbi:MAG TPA: hypothetical protein VMA36_10120 [Candidatus Limnocylindria bacterium]|nr:hypothetical protein [Candidatus Limnocylindria bacterium]
MQSRSGECATTAAERRPFRTPFGVGGPLGGDEGTSGMDRMGRGFGTFGPKEQHRASMFSLFQCPLCKTSYGSFKEVWECVQWHPKFKDEAEGSKESGAPPDAPKT